MSSVKDLLRGDVVDGSGTANNVAKWSDADTLTDSVIYDDGTNVGIGTSSPSVGGGEGLNVYNSAGASSIHFTNNTTGVLGSDGTDLTAADLDFYLINREVGSMQFWTNSTERMRITSGGNVGIGTSSPSSRLHINSSAQEPVRLQGGTHSLYLYQDVGGLGWATGTGLSGSAVYYGETNGTVQYFTSGSERMRITSGGEVLIGTSSSIGAAGNARFQLVQSNPNWVHFVQNSAASGAVYCTNLSIGNQAPNNTISAFIAGGDSSAERFRIYSNGGLANYQANNVNLSDERVKTDINPLGSYWDKFKALELVTFKYKDQSHNDDNIGLIAQQVESVAPEFVSNEGFGETPEGEEPLKTIYTADLYHATIKVLQEAMTKIENLEAEIETLKAQING